MTAKRPTYLTPSALAVWIPQLQKEGRLWAFYKTKEWKDLRQRTLEAAHFECEDCKAKTPTVIERATCVHHDREVGKYPELALSTFYIDNHGKPQKQLYALCAKCHNIRHNRFRGGAQPENPKEPLTPERW